MKKKILIIEDDRTIANTLAQILSSKYQVLLAETGAAGLTLASEQSPDLIILDLILPDQTGFAVLHQLQQNKATEHSRVVVATNLSDAETVSKIMAAGGRDYIVKSDWSIDAVAKKIDELMS